MCQCSTIQFTKNIHDSLVSAGSIPVVGVLPSLLHAAISIVETIVGLVFLVLLSPFFLIFAKCCPDNGFSQFISQRWVDSMAHLVEGTACLGIALSNIVTLGFLLNVTKGQNYSASRLA